MTDPDQPAQTLAGLVEEVGGIDAMRGMFGAAPLQRFLGMELLEASATRVVITMPVANNAMNSAGNLHGGALATLVDVTAGTAAALGSGFRPGLETIVTADLHVRYLGRPRTDVVRAEASVLRAGRQLVVVECRVLDGEDRVLVAADFSSMIVPLRQPLAAAGGTGSGSVPDL